MNTQQLDLSGLQSTVLTFSWGGGDYQLRTASVESARAYRAAMLKAISFDPDTGKIKGLDGAVFEVQNRLARECLYQLIDGKPRPVTEKEWQQLDDTLAQRLVGEALRISNLDKVMPDRWRGMVKNSPGATTESSE